MTTAAERGNDGAARQPPPVLVYSVGHGRIPVQQLLELLRRFGIGQVVDVRAIPRSRHAPEYDRRVLSPFLRLRRIRYLHLKELGGVRRRPREDSPNRGWRNAALRGYADYMLTPPFRAALNRLLQLARHRVTALFCSEEAPWRCHRSLIADALVVRGVRVIHIGTGGDCSEHLLSPLAVVQGERLSYPPPQDPASGEAAQLPVAAEGFPATIAAEPQPGPLSSMEQKGEVMERNEMIDLLNALIQLDVDAVEAYDQVIRHIEYHDIARKLKDFQDDHKNHIKELSAMVQHLDGRPVKPSPDLKGYLMEGFTALMSVAGSLAAMEAMQLNEVVTNKRYAHAAAQDLPEEVMKLIQTNHSQEQRHLRYIQQVIATPRHELR